MNVAIIPARGSSRRIPRKNIRPFHGKPILVYSIEAARATKLFDRIYVTTDDPMIGVAAMHARALPLLRPPELAVDEVGTQEVARDVIAKLPEIRYACCIYATAPLMDPEDIHRGFAVLVNEEMDFVYSVGPDGADAGQFYWGRRQAFLDRLPLTSPHVRKMAIAPERVCDINVEDDWIKAERMFTELTVTP